MFVFGIVFSQLFSCVYICSLEKEVVNADSVCFSVDVHNSRVYSTFSLLLFPVID